MRASLLLRHVHGHHVRSAIFTKTPSLMAAMTRNPASASASTAVTAPPLPPLKSQYEVQYDPTKVLEHPDFRKLKKGDAELDDKTKNLACCYNPQHEVNMVVKPTFKPGRGEALVHVRATGICG